MLTLLILLSGACSPTQTPTGVASQPTSSQPTSSQPTSSQPTSSQPTSSQPSKDPLPSLDRQGFDQFLASQRGKVVFVDFWATWCQPCVAGYPHTRALAEKYRGHDLVVAAISLDEPEGRDAVIRFVESHQADFPNFISTYGTASGQSMEEFEIRSGTIPTMKLYDREGKLRATFGDGQPEAISWEAIDVAIRALVMEPSAASRVR